MLRTSAKAPENHSRSFTISRADSHSLVYRTYAVPIVILSNSTMPLLAIAVAFRSLPYSYRNLLPPSIRRLPYLLYLPYSYRTSSGVMTDPARAAAVEWAEADWLTEATIRETRVEWGMRGGGDGDETNLHARVEQRAITSFSNNFIFFDYQIIFRCIERGTRNRFRTVSCHSSDLIDEKA